MLKKVALCLVLLLAACSSKNQTDRASTENDSLSNDVLDDSSAAPVAAAPIVSGMLDATTLRLSWSPVSGADHYKVCLAQEPVVDVGQCPVLAASQSLSTEATRAEFYNLDPAADYYYSVAAVLGDVLGASSPSVNTADLPGPILGLEADPQTTIIEIKWLEARNASGYVVCLNTVNFERVEDCTSAGGASFNSLSVNWRQAVDPAQLYYLRVMATNELGMGPSSALLEIAQLQAPDLSIGPMSSQAVARWTLVNGASGYDLCVASEPIVDYKNCNSHQDAQLLSDVRPGQLISGLKNSEGYYAIVVPFTELSSGPPSLSVAFTPSYTPDTGVLFGGEYPASNVENCDGDIIKMQDCYQGRDGQAGGAKIGFGPAGFDFFKLDASGEKIEDQQKDWHADGNESSGEKWSCILDNHSELNWQVWQSIDALQSGFMVANASDRVSWYQAKRELYGENAGVENSLNACSGYQDGAPMSYCNTQRIVERTNAQGYCGFNDWRLPKVEELRSIADYGAEPVFDLKFHPFASNAQKVWAAESVDGDDQAFAFDLRFGNAGFMFKDQAAAVLLVRGQWKP